MNNMATAIAGLLRERVWLSLFPGTVFPGVVLWRRWGVVRVLYWEGDASYQKILLWPSRGLLHPRSAPIGVEACGG